MNLIKYITFFFLINIVLCQKILIPMDNVQTNHLKAYGIAFLHLENGNEIEWLLNYRGGSFLMDNQDNVENTCLVRGVNYEMINKILTKKEVSNIIDTVYRFFGQ